MRRNVLKRIILSILLMTAVSFAHAKENIISIKSAHKVSETVTRFEKGLASKGFTEFLKVDHAANAKKNREKPASHSADFIRQPRRRHQNHAM